MYDSLISQTFARTTSSFSSSPWPDQASRAPGSRGRCPIQTGGVTRLTTDRTQDAVVVGASIAGLFAAYRLARAGRRVRVYEARPELDPDERTLIVTPAWLRLLDFDVGEAVLNRTDTFQLISRGASARVSLREPDVILERAHFMRLLVKHARQAGAELILRHRFAGFQPGLRRRDALPLLRFRNGRGTEYREAATIIGADGVHSTVAQAVDRDGVERVSIVQARVPLPAHRSPGTVRVWFDRDSTRFFIWLIPESDETGALGLIAETEEAAERALDRFLSARGLEPIEYQKARVPL